MENVRSVSKLRVWISGAARGIGRSLVESLTAQGCACIAIVDILSESDGHRVLSHLTNIAHENGGCTNFLYYSLDIRDKISVNNSLQDAFKKFGSLNTIINNAGVVEENDVFRAMGINVIAHIRVTEFALKLFSNSSVEEKVPKVILNISSAAGLYGIPMHEYYAASKHALVGYSRSVTTRALKENVHVICVCPTWVSTGVGVVAAKHGIAAASGVNVMDIKVLIPILVRILEATDMAGKIIYVSPKTGTKLAHVSLRDFSNRTSKL